MEWCEAVHIRAARYALIKTAANSYRFQANGDLSCRMWQLTAQSALTRRLPNQSVFSIGTTTMICWIYGLARPIFGSESEEATLDGDSK